MKKKVGSSSASTITSSLQQLTIRSCESTPSTIEDYNINNTYLSEDIMIEIFLRLPLEPILKFRYVSKFWFSLLNNSSFIIKWMRFNNFKPPPWVFFYKLDRPVNESVSIVSPNLYSSHFINNHDGFSFRFLNSKPLSLNKQEEIYLLASSNGLVLCSTKRYFDYRYYVCNPLTKQWVLLPLHYRARVNKPVLHGFICESSSSSLTTKSTYYKVFRIPLFEKWSNDFILEIFSSNTGQWKKHKISCPQSVSMHFLYCKPSNVVSLNGVVYWIEGRYRIIAYDLFNKKNANGDHQCRLINLPAEARVYVDDRFLGQSEGFIGYSECFIGELSVWKLEDDFSRGSWDWRLVHSIRTVDMLPENFDDEVFKDLFPNYCFNLKPLAFNPVDQNVMILGYGSKSIFAYNMKTRILKLLSRDSYYYSSTASGVSPFVLAPLPTSPFR
ncbi:F-box domain [Macleaya cordata]|uniref:F-box domain n=1 Tax=Macleaya cordata TaxID=56857 RepID=A0A200QEK8_MACCD|nr:F-box domain [Macleaya cordata]